MKLLFVTWDGPGTNYHESLFIPLLDRSVDDDDDVRLLQFSWDAEDRVERLAALARSKGMHFEHRRVYRDRRAWKVPITLFGALLGMVRQTYDGTVDTIMARSMIPGGLAVLWTFLVGERGRFIFDADGLPADERVEFGDWSRSGLRYRLLRWLERLALRRASAVITRSSRAVKILKERSGRLDDRFIVVVNGKDPQEFRPRRTAERRHVRDRLGVPCQSPLLIYVGSIGPQYEPAFMMDVFGRVLAQCSNSRFLVLTSRLHHPMVMRCASRDLQRSLLALEAAPDEVPELVAAGDVGLAFRTPTFSQQAVSPIKVAEYLLCGVPVAYSSGVGDLDDGLNSEVGMAVAGTGGDEARRVATWVVEDVLPNREEYAIATRRRGLKDYSLEAGAAGYRRAYERAWGV